MNTNHNLFPKQIFRAYDIRGNVNLLTPELVYAIAHGLAQQYLSQQQTQITLGYDARLTSPYYAKIIASVLQSYQMSVIEIGCCSTPQMNFTARKTDGNGIMITASHNVKQDNGIKWIVQHEPPCPDMIQKVAEWAEEYYCPDQPIRIENNVEHEIKSEYCLAYQDELLNDIKLQRPLKIVIDGLNGSAGYCADLILQKMGCEVISLRTQPDGHFPDHAPDPSLSIHLTKLQEKVLLHEADLGIALDGDGDRVVLVDETAKIITADRLLSLFAQICLSTHPAHEFVFDVKCSIMVKNTVERLGGYAKMIRTGSSFLRRYIAQSNGRAVFGGEYAGHYVFNDGRGHGYDDGIYAALRVMEYLSEQPNTTLSDLLAKYPERCGTEDTYISTHGVDPNIVLGQFEGQCQNLGAVIQKIDGIRLDFEDGFGIMRASNTGEFFTVRFDADSPMGLNDIRHKFVSMLSDTYPKIAHDILNAH